MFSPAQKSSPIGSDAFFAFFFGGLSGVIMGALSEKYGTHGFEIGFAILAGAYLLAAFVMAISFFVTFKRDRITD